MNALKVSILIVGVVVVAGCSQEKPQGISGMPRGEAESMNARGGTFEKSEDPPINARTHFAAGQLAESQGMNEKAIERYQSVLKDDPHHLPSLYRLGILYAQAGAHGQAIGAWKTYLAESGNSPAGYSNLGFCYELAGQRGAAEEAYRAGVARDPKNNPCRVNYGLMLARAGRVNEAIVQLQAVLPEAQVHYNLGSVYEQLGRRELARGEYRRATELDPTLVEAKDRLAGLGGDF